MRDVVAGRRNLKTVLDWMKAGIGDQPPPTPPRSKPMIKFKVTHLIRLASYTCPTCLRPLAARLEDRATTVVIPTHLRPESRDLPVGEGGNRPSSTLCRGAGTAFEVPLTEQVERPE